MYVRCRTDIPVAKIQPVPVIFRFDCHWTCGGIDLAHARTGSPAEILLVDDDENFAYFTRRALTQANLAANLHHVNNGKRCLEFLRRQPPYADAPVPDLVLLDIEMPVMDGRRVMAEIVGDEGLKHLPVIVFTSRDERAEILGMYRLRCNSYIRKPDNFEEFAAIIKKVADYWLSVVVLPSRPQ